MVGAGERPKPSRLSEACGLRCDRGEASAVAAAPEGPSNPVRRAGQVWATCSCLIGFRYILFESRIAAIGSCLFAELEAGRSWNTKCPLPHAEGNLRRPYGFLSNVCAPTRWRDKIMSACDLRPQAALLFLLLLFVALLPNGYLTVLLCVQKLSFSWGWKPGDLFISSPGGCHQNGYYKIYPVA